MYKLSFVGEGVGEGVGGAGGSCMGLIPNMYFEEKNMKMMYSHV